MTNRCLESFALEWGLIHIEIAFVFCLPAYSPDQANLYGCLSRRGNSPGLLLHTTLCSADAHGQASEQAALVFQSFSMNANQQHLQPVAPGHSFLFGHLLLLGNMSKRLPKDAHYQYMFSEIYRDHFESTGVYYLDLWPMIGFFMCIHSPTTAISVMQTNTLITARKVDLLPRFFKPVAGGPCLSDMPEDSWRLWRAVFNKAINNEHFQKLVPGMVKQIEVYKDILREHAEKSDMFYLDTTTLRFTMDLIGKTIMNTEFHA
ncbi:hypothetical protein BOTCAL_0529g00010 [Botryotinia calthae]|uniref:Uncharacterized protein n=1 Tax=Botryotinia calthae TaxID=38488 RepID=A0A4Y8CMC6_9HELO|nr:hypothetical protein BOTCAL_0529g00010 [Botryotinia calthae]